MMMKKVGILLAVVLAALLPVTVVEAKDEETFEVEIVDMGNGIWVPSSFDVKDENGNFVTLSSIDTSIYQAEEIGESVTVTLDNGYKAVKSWHQISPNDTQGYPYTSVYDENGNLMSVIGCNGSGNVIFGMNDEDGNSVKNTYTRYRYTSLEGETGEYERYEKQDEGNMGAIPLKRTTYNEEERVAKEYEQYNGHLQIDTKTEFKDNNESVCTKYGKDINFNTSYDQEDEYYESYSFVQKDMENYEANTLVNTMGSDDEFEYETRVASKPSVITQNGQELHIYKLPHYFEDAQWATESDKEAAAFLDGRPIDIFYYFTEEQIQIIEAEGIKNGDELMKKHPDFMDTFGGYKNVIRGNREEESEEEKKVREATEAIITPQEQEAEKAEEQAENSRESVYESPNHYTVILPDGFPCTWQKITGDVVPINGMVPAWVATTEMNIDGQTIIQPCLYDENLNPIPGGFMNTEYEYMNYEYVYFTLVEPGIGLVELAGTNSPVSGNLSYQGEATYDTYPGQETTDVYYQDYSQEYGMDW